MINVDHVSALPPTSRLASFPLSFSTFSYVDLAMEMLMDFLNVRNFQCIYLMAALLINGCVQTLHTFPFPFPCHEAVIDRPSMEVEEVPFLLLTRSSPLPLPPLLYPPC